MTEDGRWQPLPVMPTGRTLRLNWTGGFVAGQLWLASRLPGRAGLAGEAAAITDLLAPRAAQPTTLDLGFLFWPSAVLGYRASGDARLRRLALQAAASLASRRLPIGVIQQIGDLEDPELRGRAIVDALPNLTLLWWAGRERDQVAATAARSHLSASLPVFFRPDGSTIHFARFADDGSVLERDTIHGYSVDSTWARGQAWAVHGLVTAARATNEPEVREWAERATGAFVDRLPPDRIPPWDFDAPAGGPRDASAAAIAASALLDLGGAWREPALALLDALIAGCLEPDGDGILQHCCYSYPLGLGVDSATAWGDFFFLDALLHAVAPEARIDPLA